MRYIFSLSIFLILYGMGVGCAPEADSSGAEEEPTVSLECQFTGEEAGNPRYDMYIRIGEYQMKVAVTHACDPIGKDAFAALQIPENALAAAGGRSAGAGDYLYVMKKGENLEVYQGTSADDNSPISYRLIAVYEDGAFKFEPI